MKRAGKMKTAQDGIMKVGSKICISTKEVYIFETLPCHFKKENIGAKCFWRLSKQLGITSVSFLDETQIIVQAYHKEYSEIEKNHKETRNTFIEQLV